MSTVHPILSACPIGLEISGVNLMRKSGIPPMTAYAEMLRLGREGKLQSRWIPSMYPRRRMYRRVK